MNDKKNIIIGVLAVALIVLLGLNFSTSGKLLGGTVEFQKVSFTQGLYAGTSRQLSISNAGLLTTSGGITNTGTATFSSLNLDSGTTINEFNCATSSWNPASLGTLSQTSSTASTSIAMTGAALGDICFASLSTATTSDAAITCNISGTATATIVIENTGGTAVDYTTGTARVCYFGF